MNLVIKSGTNVFHGSGYYFNRNEKLAANSPVAAPGTPKRPIRNNQYGFSTGGPSVRNKAFFFTTLEIQKLTAGNTIPTTAPSNAWVANATQLLNQFNVPVNPVAVNMLALWPQESRTGPAIAQNFVSTDNNTYDSANGIFKIDQQFNEKYGLSSRYFGGGGDQVATGTYGTLARNALYGPGFRTVDLSLFKTTKLSGGTSLQLRFEIFKPVEYDQLGQPGRGHNGAPGIGAGEPFNVQLAAKFLF